MNKSVVSDCQALDVLESNGQVQSNGQANSGGQAKSSGKAKIIQGNGEIDKENEEKRWGRPPGALIWNKEQLKN